MKLLLDTRLVIGSEQKLNKFEYNNKPTELKETVAHTLQYPMMALNAKEVRELKKFLQFCKKEEFEVLEFKTTTRALTIKGEKIGFNKELTQECEIKFDLREEMKKETCKYSTEYLHKILGSFKLREIKTFKWGYKTDGILKLEINGELILLAPRYERD